MLSMMKSAALSLLNASFVKVIPALLILVVGVLVIRTVMVLIQKVLDGTNLERAAHSLVKSVARVVLYVLLGLMVADYLGIDVTGVIALASVLTLAVSLSVQNALTEKSVCHSFFLEKVKVFPSAASPSVITVSSPSVTVRAFSS